MKDDGTTPSQDHLTVMLGTKIDWILVGGHIFVLCFDGYQTLKLMPQEEMWPDSNTGERRRNIELWKWDEKGSVQQEHTNRELQSKKTWWNNHM